MFVMFVSQQISANLGVTQGSHYILQSFNIYIDDLVRKWKHLVNSGIKTSRDRYLNVLLFADDLLCLLYTSRCV